MTTTKNLAHVLCVGILAFVVMASSVHADIISYWTMDGHFEDDIADNDGIWKGLADPIFTEDRDGNADSAILLNGLDEFIQVAQSTELPLYQHEAFSVSMWVKGPIQRDKRVWSESTTRNRGALYNLGSHSQATNGAFDLYVRPDTGAAPANHIRSVAEPFDDTWHHLAVVDNNGSVAVYVDGVRDTAVIGYVRPVMDLDITTIGGILRVADDGSDHVCCTFQGAIDDVRIYDHALTDEEVAELCPPEPCPEEGDTHCDDLLVDGPADGSPGEYTITALDAIDDSGDAISYTFTIDDGQGGVTTIGPQVDNFIIRTLGAGEWIVSVTVDDDPLCDDAAADATCAVNIDVECPAEGDTRCDSLEVVGPDGNVPGTYTLNALATDDSLDIVTYTFRAQNGDDPAMTVGPTQNPSASFVLTTGTWTFSVTVDDGTLCDDVADTNTCTVADFEIEAPKPMMVAHYTLDGFIEDETGNTEGATMTGADPVYVDGFDDTEEGAAQFNGVDDLISLNWAGEAAGGLALYGNEAYTVAMWVRGCPQPDYRVFSEASTTDNNPLVNIGTQNNGQGPAVDLYIRSGGAQLNHIWSHRGAFEGYDSSNEALCLEEGEWHHICWVDDGGDAVLYIDGVRDGADFSYVKPVMPTDTTTIGGILRAAPSHWFNGAIDDVRLYNYALSAEDVAALVPPLDNCPADGDTHCDDFLVEPPIDAPKDNTAGTWTVTALDALDDSGDEIWYTFVATHEGGEVFRQGPQLDPVAQFLLGGGEWTIDLSVDDVIRCPDVAADAECGSQTITVVTPEPIEVSRWTFNAHLDDTLPAMNHGEFSNPGMTYTQNRFGDADSAVNFRGDGAGDWVRAQHNSGLPLYHNYAYSIAMWVRGDGTVDNVDDRVWSESTTTSNTPLFNIGTHFRGTGPQVDVFIRANGSTPMGHRLSQGAAFDGQWHHIVWCDENGDAALYIDGVRDGTDFSYTKPDLLNMPLDITTIGGILRGGPCCLFTGDIDDVRTFNYKLSEEEITEIYNSTDDEGPRENCDVEGDEDGNGLSDCEDPACVDHASCLEEDCDTIGDEDGNGLADCDDPVCMPLPACDEGPTFVRGDSNSSGTIDLTDGIRTLNFLFTGGPAPTCMDAADASDDGQLGINDAIQVFSYLFTGGAAPKDPGPTNASYPASDCGTDPSEDGLDCAEVSATCSQ